MKDRRGSPVQGPAHAGSTESEARRSQIQATAPNPPPPPPPAPSQPSGPQRTVTIARLPRVILDQLNPRLDDGREDRHNLSGLNSLPEIQTILAAYVDSKTVTEVALVLGGFRWFEVVLGGFDSKPVTEIDLVLGGFRWF